MTLQAPRPASPAKSTEGRSDGEISKHKITQTMKSRGRPKGSLNKSKTLIPTEVANAMLLTLKSSLPEEHYEYIKGVVRDGKAVSTENEIDIMLLMLGRNLLPALVSEMNPEKKDIDPEIAEELGIDKSVKAPEFRRDVNERLKVWASIANLKIQIEKSKSDNQSDNQKKPLLEIFARSGLDAQRIGIIIGAIPGSVVGDLDTVGGSSDPSGTVPDTIPERPKLVSHSEQEPTGGSIDSTGDRSDPFRVYSS